MAVTKSIDDLLERIAQERSLSSSPKLFLLKAVLEDVQDIITSAYLHSGLPVLAAVECLRQSYITLLETEEYEMKPKRVVHYNYGDAPFCDSTAKEPQLTDREEDITCKKCLDKMGQQDAT